MADVIGIRDDMYIGKGNAYMHQVVDAVKEGHGTAYSNRGRRLSTCSVT